MSITVAELAQSLGLSFEGQGDIVLTGAREPQDAGAAHLALAMAPKFAEHIASDTQAALLWEGADWQALGLKAAIFSARGRLAMAGVTAQFAQGLGLAEGIHPSAVIDPTATIGAGAKIGPFVVIGAGVTIGENAQFASHVSIGANSTIGANALMHAGVRIGGNVRIGDDLIAQSGAVVGGDGFSFVTREQSAVEQARESLGEEIEAKGQEWLRIASLGGVEIGDNVELGANATVDQGTIRATRIGSGTKLDNLVQVGHNVVVGQHCLLCAQVAVGGSTVIGDFCVMGGQSGAADNLTIGNNVIIGGASGVLSNVAKGKMMLGYPAVEMKTHVEMYKSLRRLPRWMKKHS